MNKIPMLVAGALAALLCLVSIILFGLAQSEFQHVSYVGDDYDDDYYDDDDYNSNRTQVPAATQAAIAALVMSLLAFLSILGVIFAVAQQKVSVRRGLSFAAIVFALGLLGSSAFTVYGLGNMGLDVYSKDTEFIVSGATKASAPLGIVAAFCTIVFALLAIVTNKTQNNNDFAVRGAAGQIVKPAYATPMQQTDPATLSAHGRSFLPGASVTQQPPYAAQPQSAQNDHIYTASSAPATQQFGVSRAAPHTRSSPSYASQSQYPQYTTQANAWSVEARR